MQRFQRFFDRCLGIKAVDLVEIDVVGAKPLQAEINLAKNGLARKAFAVGIAIVTKQTKIGEVDSKAWGFLTASGIATGISWLCYFKALSLGPVSAVAPIDKLGFVVAMVLGFVILREAVKPNVLIGGLVVVVGVLITLKP